MRQRRVASVRRVSGASIAALVGLWLAPMACALAQAETPGQAGAIGLGNRGWSAADTNQPTSANELEFSARAGLASDYIYRGTTLSDHGPAAGAAFEARFGRAVRRHHGRHRQSADPTSRRIHFYQPVSARRLQRSISILA